MTTSTSTTIGSVVLEATDVAAAGAFYTALGIADRVQVRATEEPSTGFRGYTLSLVVAQPANADALIEAAVAAGATVVKPPKKSLWGYGGVVQAPDGAIWTVATSSKKDTGPAAVEYDDLVLLLGVDDVKAAKQFYIDQGMKVGRSFGGKYVEFEAPDQAIKLALYTRRAAAKNAGVDPEGTGSHRIAVIADGPAFTDPDGFVWESRA